MLAHKNTVEYLLSLPNSKRLDLVSSDLSSDFSNLVVDLIQDTAKNGIEWALDVCGENHKKEFLSFVLLIGSQCGVNDSAFISAVSSSMSSIAVAASKAFFESSAQKEPQAFAHEVPKNIKGVDYLNHFYPEFDSMDRYDISKRIPGEVPPYTERYAEFLASDTGRKFCYEDYVKGKAFVDSFYSFNHKGDPFPKVFRGRNITKDDLQLVADSKCCGIGLVKMLPSIYKVKAACISEIGLPLFANVVKNLLADPQVAKSVATTALAGSLRKLAVEAFAEEDVDKADTLHELDRVMYSMVSRGNGRAPDGLFSELVFQNDPLIHDEIVALPALLDATGVTFSAYKGIGIHALKHADSLVSKMRSAGLNEVSQLIEKTKNAKLDNEASLDSPVV